MAYLEELLPEFRKGAKIRCSNWDNGEYVYLCENGIVYDERKKPFNFAPFDFLRENWELYQEPIDWDYIIKNKCLCWFWDGHNEEMKVAGILAYYDYDNSQFRRYGGDKYAATLFDYCRPVRRDEVTFYEDKKDEI